MRSHYLFWFALLLVASCRTYVPPSQGGSGAVAPQAVVERFMQLVSRKDYVQMGWVFGTSEGPLVRRDSPSDVERRMYALATVLQHSQFTVRSQTPVPGRTGSAVEMPVRLVQRGQEYVVPFTAVRGPDGRWFVERIDIEKITAAPRATR